MAETYQGVIIKGIGGLYYALGEDEQVHVLRAKGKFRKQGKTPMVGDRVAYTPDHGDEHGWVDDILPRKSELIRPPVANIAHIVLVIASAPAPDFLLMDTLLVMAVEKGITPIFVVNKCDLDETLLPLVQREYASLHIPILGVSAKTGEGVEALQALLKEGICCFAGQSGVGKSTLLTKATGIELKTGEISRKISRGKHTTRHVELLMSEEYQVLDTPGFSLLELWSGLEPIALQNYYPEFETYQGTCRFSPCYHLSEPGCAVLEAAEKGEIGKDRLQRYHTLLRRTQEAWRKRYD